ncbi:hypothetical protein WJX72_007517 [[Myrmecia] bisecta]|uniref:RNA polymerase-associated protein LEO1 n=1 Tax=[Myrmecia] bisecta TaxID=41462 RepID=A0AAW1QFL6_9CHLO
MRDYDDEEEADDDDRDRRREEDRPLGPPLTLAAPLVDRPPSDKLRLFRQSNLVCIEPTPFDPETYEAEQEELEDETGQKRVRLRNAIRCREVVGPDGEVTKESNARFVRWSDGSLQLLLGDEVLDVTENDMRMDHNYLFVRHQGMIQGQASLATKIAFRPASLNSTFHKRLAAAVEKRHTKTFRVRHTSTVVDPKKEKAEREKAEEMRIRNREGLARRQDREMRKYSGNASLREPGPRAGISAQYLESIEEEADYEGDGMTATDRARQALQRSRRVDEQAEREAERRLANAKRAEPPPGREPTTKRPHQGHGRAVSDDEEEEVSDAEMKDFIVESDEEEERGRNQKRRRGIVLSDDDED